MLTQECEPSGFAHIEVAVYRPLSKLDHPEGNSGFQFSPSKQVPDFENDITIPSRTLCRDFRVQDNSPNFQERNLRVSPCRWPTPILLDAFISPPNSRNRLIFRKRRFFAEKMETWEFWLVCPDSGGYLKPLSTDIAGFSSYLGNAAFHGTSIIFVTSRSRAVVTCSKEATDQIILNGFCEEYHASFCHYFSFRPREFVRSKHLRSGPVSLTGIK